ncbi:MAG: hypothetical protein K6E63_08610 [Lachnospiraceae bacterium]|nr:hypothetical protein [Lachnospiraceae bacterium]
MNTAGVFEAVKKNGDKYYRASLTSRNKHISLGSYDTEELAGRAYSYARSLIKSTKTIDDYDEGCGLDFEKYVVLVNFRDNRVYIRNPIYLQKHFFFYYLDREHVFKFDFEDLFYYSEHKISRRGNHLFVADYGMQVNLHSRYGIKKHAVLNRDYRFINNDRYDYRYENIEIINRYHGVRKRTYKTGRVIYKVVILINGNYTVGSYPSEEMAAIAYNKAVDVVKRVYPEKTYEQNYVDTLSPSVYADMYTGIEISEKITSLVKATSPST